MGKVGRLTKIRFEEESTYGGSLASVQTDHAVDSVEGPGPDRELLDHAKASGSYGTRYAEYGKKSFVRTYRLEVSDDNDVWLETACATRTDDVQKSYRIDVYEAGGQSYNSLGCKCNSLEFSWADGAEVVAAMEWWGSGEIASLQTTDAISSFVPESFETTSPYKIVSFSIGGVTTFDVISARWRIDNNLIIGPMNSDFNAKSMTEGPQNYEFECELHNPSDTSLIDKMDSGTKITATVTIGDGTNTDTFTFSNCVINTPASETDPDEIVTIRNLRLTPTGASQFGWEQG